MELVLEGNNDVLRIRVIGELTSETCSDLRDTVLESAARIPSKVLLDMGETPFLDTCGLGLLVGLHQRLRNTGTTLEVTNPAPRVRQTLRATRLLGVFGLQEEG